MAGKGWISIHRKMLDNPIVCKDSDHMAVWVYLLLNATHTEYPALFSGNKIMLQPGQLLTGRKSISEKLKISESKVQRILKTFEIEHQIEQQNCNKNRLVTLVSWSEYQDCEQQTEQQLNNKRTTTEQQLNTNNNVNNKNNENNKNKKEYTSDFESFWNTYPRRIGKQEAFKTWKTVLKSGEDPNIIIQCAANYKNRCDQMKTEPQYIKHPKTFLNEERYKDYLKEEHIAKKPKAGISGKAIIPMALDQGDLQEPSEDEFQEMLRMAQEMKKGKEGDKGGRNFTN